MSIPTAMRELVFRFFGAGALPNYGASPEIFDRDAYRPVREELDRRWGVLDYTDTSSDLSFVYALSSHAAGVTVRLSAVGPYAVIVSSEGEAVRPPDICAILEAEGFQVLGRTLLDQPLDIWAPEVTGVLYEFVFEFDLGTPWNRDDCYSARSCNALTCTR